MKELDKLKLIRVVLPARDRQLPFQKANFFSFFFHQRVPIFDMQSANAASICMQSIRIVWPDQGYSASFAPMSPDTLGLCALSNPVGSDHRQQESLAVPDASSSQNRSAAMASNGKRKTGQIPSTPINHCWFWPGPGQRDYCGSRSNVCIYKYIASAGTPAAYIMQASQCT